MSSLIETNNEELQSLLNDVYNLPARNAGGNGYDLEIYVNTMGITGEGPVPIIRTDTIMQPDWTKVQNAINKLRDNEQPINVSVSGYYFVPASTPTFFSATPTLSTLVYDSDWGVGLKLLLSYNDWWGSAFVSYYTVIYLFPDEQVIEASGQFGTINGDWSYT